MADEVVITSTDPPSDSNEEIREDLEEATEDVDELVSTLAAHATLSETRHTEILERIDQCRTISERLSATSGAENPMLTQLLNQMVELRAELSTLKSSMDSRQNLPVPNVSEIPPEEQSPVVLTEELSVENEVPVPTRKNRFI